MDLNAQKMIKIRCKQPINLAGTHVVVACRGAVDRGELAVILGPLLVVGTVDNTQVSQVPLKCRQAWPECALHGRSVNSV